MGSCCTIAICERNEACVACATFWPSIRIRPSDTSYSRWISFTNVVLPEPERPTSPMRSQIAIVQQEPILFHRSLSENIAYARPEASQAEIEHAARLANAHEFIERLPRKYQTLVGERGVKLSGGERQRVALARAFARNAPILILDEATSSLDSESEGLIQEAMARLMAGRTSIVIAHRLSTVRAMDRILVFDHGRVVEEGNHEALLRRPHGHYRHLFERQSGGLIAESAQALPETGTF